MRSASTLPVDSVTGSQPAASASSLLPHTPMSVMTLDGTVTSNGSAPPDGSSRPGPSSSSDSHSALGLGSSAERLGSTPSTTR